MTQYSKYNFVYKMQKWMDSVPGQTFLNYAYSWGASIVILGTLFKLTHLPGANFMLYLGMGTEVIVFFLSAFDRPFDKTAIGMDLPTSLDKVEEEIEREEQEAESKSLGSTGGGSTIIIGGGSSSSSSDGRVAAFADGQNVGTPTEGTAVVGNVAWLGQQQEITPEMAEATGNYVEELKKLTETLTRVSEQSQRLTRDSEEMENLNRTLTGICKIYEMQLKGASAQVGTIDQINEQTRKMAGQIEQLNKIYARMIEAMTVNMRAAAPGANIPTNEE